MARFWIFGDFQFRGSTSHGTYLITFREKCKTQNRATERRPWVSPWGKSNPRAGPAHPRGPFSISSSYSNTICIFQSSQNGSAMPKSRNTYVLLCQMRQGAPLEILPTRRIRLRSRIVTPNAFSDKLFFLRRKWMSAFYYGTQMNCPDLSAAGAAQRPLKTGNRRITHYYCTKSDFSGPPKKLIERSFGAGKTTGWAIWPEIDPPGASGSPQKSYTFLDFKAKQRMSCFHHWERWSRP